MTDITSEIRGIVVERRNSQNFTQSQVADYLKISLRKYQRYEYGETSLTINDLIRLFTLLNISVNILIKKISNHFDRAQRMGTRRGNLNDSLISPLNLLSTDFDLVKNARVNIVEPETLRKLVYTRDQLERAIIGYWEWGLETNDYYWSPEMYEVYDLPKNAAISQFVKRIPEEDIVEINKSIENLVMNGAPYFNIHRYYAKNELRVVHSYAFKHVCPNQGIIVYGVARLMKRDETLRPHSLL